MPSLPARPVRRCPKERRAAGSSEQPAGEDEELGNKSCYSHACFLSRDRERKANKSLPKELLGGKFHRLACFSWGNAKREWVLQGDPRGSVSAETPRVCTCVRVCVCAHGGHCLPLLAGSEKRCRSLHHHQASVELVPADPKQSAPQTAQGAKGAPFKCIRRILAASALAVAPSWLSSAGTRHPQQGLVPLCWLPAAPRAGPSTFPSAQQLSGAV